MPAIEWQQAPRIALLVSTDRGIKGASAERSRRMNTPSRMIAMADEVTV